MSHNSQYHTIYMPLTVSLSLSLPFSSLFVSVVNIAFRFLSSSPPWLPIIESVSLFKYFFLSKRFYITLLFCLFLYGCYFWDVENSESFQRTECETQSFMSPSLSFFFLFFFFFSDFVELLSYFLLVQPKMFELMIIIIKVNKIVLFSGWRL